MAQAHQEFTKLVDKISAKFVQLDSGEFGAVGTPAFNAKMHELAVLFARMSQLCQRLGLPVLAHLCCIIGSTNPCRITRKEFPMKQTKMYVCTLEEFMLVDIWIHCCASWKYYTVLYTELD